MRLEMHVYMRDLMHHNLIIHYQVDVEGAEGDVLRGMQELFAAKRVRHLVVEISPSFYKRDGIPRTYVHEGFKPLLDMGCEFKHVGSMQVGARDRPAPRALVIAPAQ